MKSGAYSRSDSFTHHNEPFWELKGKRMGIIGLGTIGRQVARIAESFGMEVVFYSTTGRNNHVSYKRFDLDDLLKSSDVVSIHAPLNDNTRYLITYEKIKLMRPCAILLNLGRGGIVNEADLARALNDNVIGAAGIDVMEQEPMNADNPLLKLYDKEKILITPHMAWASKESRELLVEKISRNIALFQKEVLKGFTSLKKQFLCSNDSHVLTQISAFVFNSDVPSESKSFDLALTPSANGISSFVPR